MRLHKNLREDLKPLGALEELLVERIAICFWRLRRILRYDFGIKQAQGLKVDVGNRVWTEKLDHIDQLTALRQRIEQEGPTLGMKKATVRELRLNANPSTITDQLLLPLVDNALAQLRDSLPRIKEELEAAALGNALTGRHADTLLRYETANERQLYRAIDQLERLQRQRAGDYVPPPVKVGVFTDV